MWLSDVFLNSEKYEDFRAGELFLNQHTFNHAFCINVLGACSRVGLRYYWYT